MMADCQRAPQTPNKVAEGIMDAPRNHREISRDSYDSRDSHGDEQRGDRSAFQTFVETKLETVSMVLVMSNVVFMFVQLQLQGYAWSREVGLTEGSTSEDTMRALFILEHVFNACFILELCAKVAAFRKHFFYDLERRSTIWANVLDACLVVGTSIDLYILALDEAIDSVNLNVFRPLRSLRLVKTLRILQAITFFFKLRVLINTVLASFMALFWSLVMLIAVMLMGAMFLCQGLSNIYSDTTIDLVDRQWVHRHYGTSLKATYTIFEVTFSGGWPNYARRLVEKVDPAWALFFFVYVIVVIFTMFRIVTALFLRDTMALAAQDAEMALCAEEAKKKAVARKLLGFFEQADVSGDGKLTFEEFEVMLTVPKVRAMLSALEIPVDEAEDIFHLVEDENGEVSDNEFVRGMMRMKGGAKSQDILALSCQNKKLMTELASIKQACSAINDSLWHVPANSSV